MLIKKLYQYCLIFFLSLSLNGFGQQSKMDTIHQHAHEASAKLASSKNDSLSSPDFHASTTIFQKISRDSFFEVVLETNFDSLIKNKKVSSKKYPGTILFKNADGEKFKMKVKIEPRGRSRRKVCSMPPLKKL